MLLKNSKKFFTPLLIYALTHGQQRLDPERLQKRRREIHVARRAKSQKPKINIQSGLSSKCVPLGQLRLFCRIHFTVSRGLSSGRLLQFRCQRKDAGLQLVAAVDTFQRQVIC
jgi:hypothetical protein